jgi:hypothetical protein
VAEDFRDADDGDFGIIGDNVNASGAHLWAAHAEEGHIDPLLQGGCQARSVHIPGSFACGK